MCSCLQTLIACLALFAHVAAKTCSSLRNRDIFSTVEIKVGTPPQRFELVADTGSNTLIVQSCVCQELGSCPSSFGRCFRGNATSTFSMPRSANSDARGDPRVWILRYGSGDIEALVATDVVALGNYTAQMNSSLLLMVSQSLNFDAAFEGILGLGVPNVTATVAGPHRQPQLLTSFLDGASVGHFSLCFNSGADGVLALDYGMPPRLLPITSHEHWQLKLLGASVAGHKVSMGQEGAPHAAIPDSGTTLITGPQEQISALLESICDEWPRCKQAKQQLNVALVQIRSQTASAGEVSASRVKRRLLAAYAKWHRSSGTHLAEGNSSFAGSGAFALQMLMEDCSSWKHGIQLNAEMPPIKLHLEGADGTKQDVQLLPSSYVAEVTSNAMVWTEKYLLGILPYWWPELEEDSSCAMLVGTADYVGHEVWILGTPLFYDRRVHFDLRDPPGVGFSEEPCGSCVSGEYQTDVSLVQGVSPTMRQLKHPGRVPWPKASQPLQRPMAW